jgi:hypothetical protein
VTVREGGYLKQHTKVQQAPDCYNAGRGLVVLVVDVGTSAHPIPDAEANSARTLTVRLRVCSRLGGAAGPKEKKDTAVPPPSTQTLGTETVQHNSP